MNNHPWQAQVMAEAKRAELIAAADEARRVAAGPRRPPVWVAAAERTGLFLIRRGEQLRRDALRHRPAPVS